MALSASSFSEADYCISLRIWDVLLWFAIMQRPRRDVGICIDFANTLAECSIQLLPRSVFPFDLVPMTRIDPIERMQVLMETQFQVEKYGGKVFRPAVIPRHINTSITTSNFKLECEGKICTKVLEDEMYMSEIIMASEDMGIKWNEFPVDHRPSLNIFWEYDVFYPMSLYKKPTELRFEDDEWLMEKFANSLQRSSCSDAVMYMNPSRHSMMLYVIKPNFGEEDSMWKADDVLMDGGPGWTPVIELAHEFSLLPHLDPVAPIDSAFEEEVSGNSLWGKVTTCSSVLDMQNRLFKLGFGPLPNFRRAGVLVHMSPNEFDDDYKVTYMLGCIVAHRCVFFVCIVVMQSESRKYTQVWCTRLQAQGLNRRGLQVLLLLQQPILRGALPQHFVLADCAGDRGKGMLPGSASGKQAAHYSQYPRQHVQILPAAGPGTPRKESQGKVHQGAQARCNQGKLLYASMNKRV